jgi:hypothetical protein
LNMCTGISEENSMKRELVSVFMALLLVPILFFVKPAPAMSESDAGIIVDAAYQAVQNSLNALEAANASGDVNQVNQALQALNLSIKNYAVSSENFARVQAGEVLDDSTLTACYLIADNLSLFSSQLLASQLEGARASLREALRLEAFLSSPANPGVIPAGLEDLNSRIIASSTEAVAILRGEGAPEEQEEGGEGKLGINTHVGSPI